METVKGTNPLTESVGLWKEPACLLNGEGRVLLASKGLGEIAGKDVADLSDLDPELFIQSLEGTPPATWQIELLDPDGTRMDLLVLEPDPDKRSASGRTVRSPGIDLDRLNAIGEVVPPLFHDLNNMLASISGISELAAMKLPDGDPMQQRLNRVVDTVVRASDLSRQISLLVRTPPEKTSPVNLVNLIDEAMILARCYLNRGITLETSWPDTRLTTDLHPSTLRHLMVEIILAAGIIQGDSEGTLRWTVDHGEKEATGRPTALLTVTTELDVNADTDSSESCTYPLGLFRRFATLSSLANSFGGCVSPIAVRQPRGFTIRIALPVIENPG